MEKPPPDNPTDTRQITKTTLSYKSEKNEKKYKFPKIDKSEKELGMYSDKRDIYQIFRDLIMKITDKIPKDDIDTYNTMCGYDLRIPQYSPSGVPMLKEEIQDLMRQFKKQHNLDRKKIKTIEETEAITSLLPNDAIPDSARKGGFTVPHPVKQNTAQPPSTPEDREGASTISPVDDTAEINECLLQNYEDENDTTCLCCAKITHCIEENECCYDNCKGHCANITMDSSFFTCTNTNQQESREENDETEAAKAKESSATTNDPTCNSKTNSKEQPKGRKKNTPRKGLECDERQTSAKDNLQTILEKVPAKEWTPEIRNFIRKVNLRKANKTTRKAIRKTLAQLDKPKEHKEKEQIDVKINKVHISNAERLPYIDVRICSRINSTQGSPTPLLVDSGSELNILKHKEVKKLIRQDQITPINNLVLSTASGQSDRDMVLGKITLTLLVNNGNNQMFPIKEEFHIVRDDCPLQYGILGTPFFKSHHLTMSFTPDSMNISIKIPRHSDGEETISIPCRDDNRFKVSCVFQRPSTFLSSSIYNITLTSTAELPDGRYHIQSKNDQIHGAQIETSSITTILNTTSSAGDSRPILVTEKSPMTITLSSEPLLDQETPLTLIPCPEHECQECFNKTFATTMNIMQKDTSNLENNESRDTEENDKTTKPDKSKKRMITEKNCLCPEHNPYVNWTIPKEEIEKFGEYLCPHHHTVHATSTTSPNPCTSEFSDDPLEPPLDNVGEEILKKRDLMNTVIVENSSLDLSHLTTDTQEKLTKILQKYSDAVQTDKNKIGNFKYFEASFRLDDVSGASQKNRNVNFARAPEAIKKIEELRDLGVLETSNGPKTIMNFVLVKKFQGLRLLSKADKHLASQSSTADVKWRLAVDASTINRHLVNIPQVILPRSEDIRKNIRNKIFSSIDLVDQFFAIRYDQESRKYCNVYYGREIVQFRKVLQGLASSPYHSQSAMNITFADVIFNEWKLRNKISSSLFPYTSYRDFEDHFLDDILIFSDINLGVEVHLLCIDAVMYALERAGWIIGLKKCQFFSEKIKWLGVDLNAKEGTAEINADRAQAILDTRNPRSCAEASSRMSLILYCAGFLPLLKKIMLPITNMIKGAEFYWDKACAHAFNEIKMLISLNIKNVIFDPDKALVIETDSSKVAVAGVLWQVNDLGTLELLSTSSSVLALAQMRSPSVIRETSAMTYSIDKFEEYILGSHQKCFLISDASALACLARSKNSSSRFYEQTILLTSYPNLEVVFLRGRNLVIADVLSRAFNESYIQGETPLSSKMSSIIPPVPSHLFKKIQVMSHEDLTDFLLSDSPHEFVDIFDKQDWYKQAINHKSEVERMLSSISPEQSILYFLRQGWTNPSLFSLPTLRDLLDKQKKLSKTSLEEVVKKHQLAGMRKIADNLKVQDEFLKKITRNFKPDDESRAKTAIMSRKITMVETRSARKGHLQEPRLTRSRVHPKKIKCPIHPEGHESSEFSRLLDRSLGKLESLIQALSSLSSLSNSPDIHEVCGTFLQEQCSMKKIEICQSVIGQVFSLLSSPRDFVISQEEDEHLALCFFAAESSLLSVTTSHSEFIFQTNQPLALKEFETFSHRLFFFASFQGEYSIIQGSDQSVFIDMSINEVNGFICEAVTFFNLESKPKEIPEGHTVLKLNLTQSLNARGKLHILFIPIEKNTVEANLRKFDALQQTRAQNLLESNLENYAINATSHILDANNSDVSRKYIEALNLYIISSRLSKIDKPLNDAEIIRMQGSDPCLRDIRNKCLAKDGQHRKYVLLHDILFLASNNTDHDDQTPPKLCLPSYIIRMLTSSYHAVGNSHLTASNVANSLGQLFHHPNLFAEVKKATNSCLSCALTQDARKITIRGEETTLGRDLLPGEVIQVDSLYLPVTNQNRNKAALIIVDTATSYISVIEMPSVSQRSTIKAIRHYFQCMGLPRAVKCDLGNEFGSSFIQYLANLGVNTITTVPRLSNSVAQAEKSIDIIKRCLNKVVSQYLPSRRLQWEDSLPLILSSINTSAMRSSKFTRRQLMFSPLHFHFGRIMLAPASDETIHYRHQEGLKALNRLRDAGMARLKKGNKLDVKEGEIVVEVMDDTRVATGEDGTKGLIPTSTDIIKVIETGSGGFGIRGISLISGNERTIRLQDIRPFTLDDTLGIQLRPDLLFKEIKESRFRQSFRKYQSGMKLPSSKNEIENLKPKENQHQNEDVVAAADINHTAAQNKSPLPPRSILKQKECFYKHSPLKTMEKEFIRHSLSEHEAFRKALESQEDIPLHPSQKLFKSFSFECLDKYSLLPLTDQKIGCSHDRKIVFNLPSSSPLAPSPSPNPLSEINYITVAGMIFQKQFCLSRKELSLLN